MVPQSYEHTGSVWHPKAHSAEGNWKIEAAESGLIFQLGADFHIDWAGCGGFSGHSNS